MAEGTTDPTISLDSMKQLHDLILSAASGSGDLSARISNISTNLKSLETDWKNNSRAVSGFTSGISESVLKVDLLTTGVLSVGKAFQSASVAGGSAFNPINAQFDEFSNKLASSGKSFSTFLQSFMGIDKFAKAGFLGKTSDELINIVKRNMELAGANQRVETSYLQLMGASGQLGKVYQSLGGDLAGLTNVTGQYMKHVADTAMATGLETKEVLKFAEVMSKIPGALQQNIFAGVAAGGSINSLEAALKIASGTGRSFEAVVADIQDGVMNLSGSGGLKSMQSSLQDAMQYTTLMTDATSALEAKFDDIHGYMQTTGSQFKFVGNNAEAAANIVVKYGDALKQTGLSSKSAIEMVGGLTNGLGGLNLATKAFLSSQSGGKGGLQGAFQIDKSLRDGKMDEVMTMMEKTLKKQFGGKIVNLDEASNSSQAASQMTKQLAFLRQGPFGQLAKSDAEGYRLMEAFGKTGEARTAPLKKEDSLEKTVKFGSELQDRNTTLFAHMNVNLEKQTSYQSQMARALTTDLFGATSANASIREANRFMKEDVGSEGARQYEQDGMNTRDDVVKQNAGKTMASSGVILAQAPEVAAEALKKLSPAFDYLKDEVKVFKDRVHKMAADFESKSVEAKSKGITLEKPKDLTDAESALAIAQKQAIAAASKSTVQKPITHSSAVNPVAPLKASIAPGAPTSPLASKEPVKAIVAPAAMGTKATRQAFDSKAEGIQGIDLDSFNEAGKNLNVGAEMFRRAVEASKETVNPLVPVIASATDKKKEEASTTSKQAPPQKVDVTVQVEFINGVPVVKTSSTEVNILGGGARG